ncbi:peritrophin-1-like [Anopheles funestus]|uniref:Chitin-binding type-2 domain-containing protein n=1 Tax=Anopheles funestus TaxID=62324 RepID=A0A182RJS2_ANOFN|nr:peritrophin-1-like [Anopheles funestus]
MKEYLLLVIFLTVANIVACAVVQQRNEPLCMPEDDYFAAGPECYNFYSCRNGVLDLIECPAGLLWNDDISRCDEAENVQCQDEGTTVATLPPSTEAPTLPPTTSAPSNTFMPEVEGALPILFPGSECPPNIRAFLLHASDCRRFFYCLYGIQYPQTCPFLETFNFVVGHCVPREQTFCFPGSV